MPDFYAAVQPNQRRFLRCYEACASITRAARWAKVTRQAHYWWLEEEGYREAFAHAEIVAERTLEDEAVRRANEGVRKAVRYKGKIVGYETEYSDALMLRLLSRQKRFRKESSDSQQSFASNKTLTFDVARRLLQEGIEGRELP